MEEKKNKKKLENPAKGLDLAAGLLANTGQAAPAKEEKGRSKDNKVETPNNSWTHFTAICSVELVEKIKAIAQREGFSIRDVVDKSYRDTISRYEAKHGKIKLKAKKEKNIDDVL